MGTKNDVVIMSGEGMLALWGAMKSCLRPGDPVLCVGTGLYGDGNADMARALGCRVELVSQPYDTVIDDATLERVEDAAKRLHPVMITAVHGETPWAFPSSTWTPCLLSADAPWRLTNGTSTSSSADPRNAFPVRLPCAWSA